MNELLEQFAASCSIGPRRAPESAAALRDRFAATGLANWWIPAEYGGRGLALPTTVEFVIRLAEANASAAFGLFNTILATTIVELCGTDEQRARILGGLARTGGFAAVAAAEHEAGSELGELATTLQERGDELALSGKKAFCTNAAAAELVVVIARDQREHGSSSFCAAIVSRDDPGLVIGERWATVGLAEAEVHELELRDCTIAAADLIPGNGVRALELGLNATRLLHAATAVGLATRLRDELIGYAIDKPLRGARLVDHPVFIDKLGEIELRLAGMRMLVDRAAERYAARLATPADRAGLRREGSVREILVAKRECARIGASIAELVATSLGGIGYTEASVVARLAADMRYVAVVEGGDEVMRELMVSRYLRARLHRRQRTKR